MTNGEVKEVERYIQLRIDKLEELLNEKLLYLDQARRLQALEYTRRLEIIDKDADTLKMDLVQKINDLEKSRSISTGQSSGISSMTAYIVMGILAVVAVAGFIVSIVR